MIPKDITQIKEEDLQSLIDNAVSERKTLEYKQILKVISDGDRKEFLADVSSFANASGGDLIIGISTKEETPQALLGIDITNDEITKLDSIIRDGIEPRLPSATIQPVPLSNSKNILIIRVAKSWISPHRVSFKGHDKFYSRSSNGKYPIDVTELRIAFNLSDTITERIRKFREERISKIYANETPVPFFDGAKIILHIIPIISFNPQQRYSIEAVTSNQGSLQPIYCSGWNSMYNLDGFLSYSGNAKEISHSYVQLYRNGIIEGVQGSLLDPRGKNNKFIPSVAYERELIASLQNYLALMNRIGIEVPIFAFLTLVGVKGYSMYVDPARFHFVEQQVIDRDILFLPEIIIDNYDVNTKVILKPCFDLIWNACGFSKSFNYDKEDNWVER